MLSRPGVRSAGTVQAGAGEWGDLRSSSPDAFEPVDSGQSWWIAARLAR